MILPGTNVDVIVGPHTDWRAQQSNADQEEASDAITPQEEQAVESLLGLSLDELFPEEEEEVLPHKQKGQGDPCEQGETASRSGCIPESGEAPSPTDSASTEPESLSKYEQAHSEWESRQEQREQRREELEGLSNYYDAPDWIPSGATLSKVENELDQMTGDIETDQGDYEEVANAYVEATKSFYGSMLDMVNELGIDQSDIKKLGKVVDKINSSLPRRVGNLVIFQSKLLELSKQADELAEQEPDTSEAMPDDMRPEEPEAPTEPEWPEEPLEPDEPNPEPKREDYEDEEVFQEEWEENDKEWEQYNEALAKWEKAHTDWDKETERLDDEWAEAQEKYENDVEAWEEKISELEDKWEQDLEKKHDAWEKESEKVSDKLSDMEDRVSSYRAEIEDWMGGHRSDIEEILSGAIDDELGKVEEEENNDDEPYEEDYDEEEEEDYDEEEEDEDEEKQMKTKTLKSKLPIRTKTLAKKLEQTLKRIDDLIDKDSWFEECPRDEHGRCKPRGTGDSESGGDKDKKRKKPEMDYAPPPKGEKIVEPPCCLYDPDPTFDDNGDGVADSSRVGVCGTCSPPPPKEIPRLPNLTEKERAAESRFADAFLADPDAMADAYIEKMQKGEIGDGPNIFGTDDAKLLSPDYNPASDDPEEVKNARGVYNAATHQTANAIAKYAFLKYLDTLPEDKKSVLVTSGGVAAGKGYALQNIDKTKSIGEQVGAVWDAAGEQFATENPWILEECKKRGIKPIFAFVHANPQETWENPDRGVVERANKKGRMVDARLHAESYALGAKNFKAFYDKHKDSGDAEFFIIDNSKGKPKLMDEMPEEALSIDAEELAARNNAVLKERESSLKPWVSRGGSIGQRIWGTPKKKAV